MKNWNEISPMRTETGPFRPEPDDWQGYFFRGDDALGRANDLRMIAQSLRDKSVPVEIHAEWLERLASRLEECREQSDA